jgi:hypothetical protein
MGLDCGTYNLIRAKRGEKENEVKYKKEVNAFLEISLDDRYTFNMLKNTGKVQLIEKDKVAYIVGEAAMKMSYALPKLELKRPMRNGCLNSSEKDAFRNLMIMIHSLMGEVENDKEIVYYSVPANALNEKTDADFHQKVLEDIFKRYNVNGKTVQAYPINEALALVFAELGDKAFTGIGLSFGGGMVNFCYSVYSRPVVQFSLVNSGDWIDQQTALVTGENVVTINKIKHTIDLTKSYNNTVERAIQAQYKILIEKTIANVKKALVSAGNAVRADEPVDIILGGGTVSPNGFEELVGTAIKESEFPIPIGHIHKPKDHLYSVAKGTLIAAENA